MGPYLDSVLWILRQQTPGHLAGSPRLAASRLPFADLSLTYLGSGLETAVAALALGALVGGLSVLLVNRRKLAEVLLKDRNTIESEHQHFLAAAEGSLDAFYILESVRDDRGGIVDFSFKYLNAQAAQRLKCHREDVVGTSYKAAMGSILDPEQFYRYCDVVLNGDPFSIDFPVKRPGARITWLRHQVVRLGDGIAVTSSDLSEFKSVQDRCKTVAEFSDMIFENAPFSIIATDAKGTITAMNFEAEELTGYHGDDLIGNASITIFHDPEELRHRAAQIKLEQGSSVEGFELIAGAITSKRSLGHPHNRTPSKMNSHANERVNERVQEEAWTFIRKDGTRISVSLTVRVLWSPAGERMGMIGIAYDLSQRKPNLNLVAPLALYDALTGLVSNNLLEDRIGQALKRSKRAGTKVAVMTIDLDHFKRINDALGHRVGDEILTIAASRLVERVRSSDTVARIGGDEFIVVISDQARSSDIEFCAEQLLRAISSPYKVHGHTINVTASVGICIYPELAIDAEHLLGRSEAAMYSAKEAGRHRSALFAPAMLEDASSRLSMEGALRQALDHNELFIEYQPQVSLPSGRVIGMEALLRWRHPRFGLVSPAHFIPMAERIGLLPDFGTWAMQRACSEARWIQERLGRRVTLSVNLSPNQFQQKKLLRSLQQALQQSGLAAVDLEIEIIENTLMIDTTENLETLQMIRDLGVRLSIDDFGTGFCNFNYLLQYEVDRLKIDQSFVRQAASDTNAASVVRTVIAMSHGLGVKVIAEGVETRDQLKFLLRRRCDQAQGYFFARPLSPAKFVESVPTIEAMNLSDPSGERVAARIALEEKPEFVRTADTSEHRDLTLI